MADIIVIVTDAAPIQVSVNSAIVQFPQVVTASSQIEEDELFAAGAKIVIRSDLL